MQLILKRVYFTFQLTNLTPVYIYYYKISVLKLSYLFYSLELCRLELQTLIIAFQDHLIMCQAVIVI